MNWTIYGIECAVSVVLFTGAIMIPLCRNAVWWIHDYPADIQEKYFETHERIHTDAEEYKRLLIEVIDRPELPILFNLNVDHALPRCIIPFGVNAVVDAEEQRIWFGN